jgi:hypothetical protein
MNRAMRADAQFLCADQASFHRDSGRDYRVFNTLHAAANSRTRPNVQLAPDQDVANDDLAGLNLEVAVVQETGRPVGAREAVKLRKG